MNKKSAVVLGAMLILSGCGAMTETTTTAAATEPGLEDIVETLTAGGIGGFDLDIAKAKDSMLSEKDAAEAITYRQFDAGIATTEYSEDGDYTGINFIRADSDEKHPQYDFYYKSDSDVTWTIHLVGKDFVAMPSSFISDDGNWPIYLTEVEGVPSYENTVNAFCTISEKNYKGIAIIETVDRIDAATLEEYTPKVLKKCEQRR